jgi:alpha-beta hydrolase superfamily lysophospholipase
VVLLVLLGGSFLACFVFNVVKELHIQAQDRRDDRIMAAYQRQEAARYHAENLAAIDRAARATAEEMVRTAADARGEIINGTAIEIKPR